MTGIELSIVLLGWGVALASPGPATLAIAGTAMDSGRHTALSLAAGVITGSATWAVVAALGLGAAMIANAWVMEMFRYFGAAYLLWLAFKAFRSAIRPRDRSIQAIKAQPAKSAYVKGLMLHLANPKSMFFWGALFAIVISPDAPLRDIVTVGLSCFTLSVTIFISYALLFSTQRAMSIYLKLGRWFDGTFALLFGAAGIKVLTTRLS